MNIYFTVACWYLQGEPMKMISFLETQGPIKCSVVWRFLLSEQQVLLLKLKYGIGIRRHHDAYDFVDWDDIDFTELVTTLYEYE